MVSVNLTHLLDERVDWRFKGFPPAEGVRFGTVGEQGWNLLAGDLPLPALVLKERALAHNVELSRAGAMSTASSTHRTERR